MPTTCGALIVDELLIYRRVRSFMLSLFKRASFYRARKPRKRECVQACVSLSNGDNGKPCTYYYYYYVCSPFSFFLSLRVPFFFFFLPSHRIITTTFLAHNYIDTYNNYSDIITNTHSTETAPRPSNSAPRKKNLPCILEGIEDAQPRSAFFPWEC